MKLKLATILALVAVLIFFGFSLPIFAPKSNAQTPTPAATCAPRAQAISQELDNLNANGVTNFLYWQYSGGVNDGTTMAGDVYSFYKGDPLCDVLKTHAGSFQNLGVNMYDLGSYNDGVISDALSYVRNSCGVNLVRVWATPDRLDGVKRALQIASSRGVKLIVTLWDTVNNSSNGGDWFQYGYQTVGYLDYIRNAVSQLRGYSSLYGYELANEPHCDGDMSCIPYYINWVNISAQAIRSIDSSHQIGIGQIAAQPGTRGDSAGASVPGYPSDFIRSNNSSSISIASAHYYNPGEIPNVLQVKDQAESIGKEFYVGEHGLECDGNFSGVPPGIPPITPYIPQQRYECSESTNPEFHALRPYPASPCDPKLLHVTQNCGNDLLLREDYNIPAPGEPENYNFDSVVCTPIDCSGGGCTRTCDYKKTATEELTVDLKDAELPIAGNTQLVPNEVNLGFPRPRKLTNAERVNNYLSWYLSGIIGQASENMTTVNRAINYSGPINKLLPESVQRYRRKIPYIGTDVNTGYHNEIVACTDGKFNPIPCLSTPGVPIKAAHIYRRKELMDSIPLETDDTSWGACPDSTKTFDCAYVNWKNTIQGKLFNYLPFQTTEDRPGLAVVDAVATKDVTAQEAGIDPIEFVQPTITQNTFSPNPTLNPTPTINPPFNNSDTLFFAHMAEVADLSRLLVGIYRPRSNRSLGEPEREGFIYEPYQTNRCEQTGRSNSGDDLYGELVGPPLSADINSDNKLDPNPQNIKGSVTKVDIFSCTFTVPDTGPGSCYDTCVNPGAYVTPPPAPTPSIVPGPGDPNLCFDKCTTACKRTSIAAPASVYTYTPRVNAIWDRLVAGPYSVFQRNMPEHSIPKARKGSHFLDEPAVTRAHYTGTGNDTAKVMAAGPATNRPGGDAEIYFPHLGGVSDYFLKEMQTALRPLGYEENPPLPTPSPGPTPLPGSQPSGLSCTMPITSCPAVDWTKPIFQAYYNAYNLDNNLNWSLVKEPFAQNLIDGSGICPQFVATIWLEETGGSAVGGYDLGCIYYLQTGQQALQSNHQGGPANFSSYSAFRNHYEPILTDQINCLKSYVQGIGNDFNTFMCQYSGEEDTDPTKPYRQCVEFVNNPNFPVNVCQIGTSVGIATPIPTPTP